MQNSKRIVPFGRHFIDSTDIASVVNVLKSDWLSQGPAIEEFERKLACYCGAKHAVAVSSGTAALHIACLAAGLKKDDEAITSPITFVATSNAVLYTGAKPVFADVDPVTVNIDPQEIANKINIRTKVILPVHYSGLPCDMPKIGELAKKRKIIIIEDACHALGAQYKHNGQWVKVGSCLHSDMAVFSFHPLKTITTGQGGAVLTNRKDLYNKLVLLRNHGITKERALFFRQEQPPFYYEMQSLGFNYRITDIQCSLGISQLKKISYFLLRRRKIARAYNRLFGKNPYFDTPSFLDNANSSWHLYTIRLRAEYENYRDEVYSLLEKKGIMTQVNYLPVYLHLYYKSKVFGVQICPESERFYKRHLNLPIYPNLTQDEVAFVATTVLKVLKEITKC